MTMKAFHTVAVPHKDILEGRLTLDVFAADLWEAYHNRGVEEYRDADLFFQKTYLTGGLNHLLEVIKKRIEGRGGDSVIQLQTPFGGGKTHSLIAVMHKAKQWHAHQAVVVGTNLSANDTIWGILEQQLTGKNNILTGLTAPGKDKLGAILASYQPLVILIDELLEYVVKAAAIGVGDSNLAAQTLAFLQELTETVSILEKTCLILTLPSSSMEQYDENAEKFYQQLQKISGRLERTYTPVSDEEIAKVIRRRLFAYVNEKEALQVVNAFINYAQRENLLPTGIEASQYRDRFLDSYPFLPEVIEVLYHRWGSFPSFQRTRGVLRILSLVIYALKNTNLPYISLADFSLADQDLRQELIKHIGQEYNSIIAQDITDANAGSKKVDAILGDSYRGLSLGSRAATTIFLYSFSGAREKGATLAEIKRNATTLNNPASVVVEAVEQLKSQLFYLQFQEDKYFFSNQPNLNRILLNKIENIRDEQVFEIEKYLLQKQIKSWPFKGYIWPENTADIPDTEEFKLVVLKEGRKENIEEIIKNKGNTRRVNCNSLVFLYPSEEDKINYVKAIKEFLACKAIKEDETYLTQEQKKELQNKIDSLERDLNYFIIHLYRRYALPTKEGYKEGNLGISASEGATLGEKLYEHLKQNGNILENLAPMVVEKKYLRDEESLCTSKIFEISYRTPGEPWFVNPDVVKKAIEEGVERGLFGLGVTGDENQIICRYFGEKPEVKFSENEVIINRKICKIKEEKSKADKLEETEEPERPREKGYEIAGENEEEMIPRSPEEMMYSLNFTVEVPEGKVSDIMGIIRYLRKKFEKIKITVEATEGQISLQEYQNKVEEAIRQLGGGW